MTLLDEYIYIYIYIFIYLFLNALKLGMGIVLPTHSNVTKAKT
jgi:hypothetical protein